MASQGIIGYIFLYFGIERVCSGLRILRGGKRKREKYVADRYVNTVVAIANDLFSTPLDNDYPVFIKYSFAKNYSRIYRLCLSNGQRQEYRFDDRNSNSINVIMFIKVYK